MPERNDEQRALLDAYAQATSPSPADVERALARSLARIANAERSASLPHGRRRVVWAIAAGFATLAIAGAALAGVRWLRARPQPDAEPYGAARLDRIDDDRAIEVGERSSAHVGAESTPTPSPPTPEPTGPVPEPTASAETPEQMPATTRHRVRATPANTPADTSEVEPPSDSPDSEAASLLAEESRLVARTRRALHDDDLEAALEWAAQHARQYPDGALTEERLILEAVAACRAGQRERGLAAADRLRQKFPKTPALTRVEQSCADE